MKNNKIKLSICAIASIVCGLAGGMFVKSKLTDVIDEDEIDRGAAEIDIFDEES